MKKACWGIMLLLAWGPLTCWAISGKGTTSATFLKIGVGPRAVAMGEAFVGVADDPSAIYWNPAGLAQLSQPEVMATHVFWFQDIFFDHLAVALPMAPGVLGASLVYLNMGELSRSEADDRPEDPLRGTFSASNIGFTAAYGYPFSKVLLLGAGLKIFSENIDTHTSLGWASDLGFLYHLPWPGLTLGALLQNLGPATRVEDAYARLPINFKLGVAYSGLPQFVFALDYNQLLEQYGKLALGAEYQFEKTLALRLGYQYQEKIDPSEVYSDFGSGGFAGLTAGLGIRYQEFRLDYAFVPYGFLGSTHRLAITYTLPQTVK